MRSKVAGYGLSSGEAGGAVCVGVRCLREEARHGRIFRLFYVFGLTKKRNGCILYDIGSRKSRCSPQNRYRPETVREARSEEFLKNLRKAV